MDARLLAKGKEFDFETLKNVISLLRKNTCNRISVAGNPDEEAVKKAVIIGQRFGAEELFIVKTGEKINLPRVGDQKHVYIQINDVCNQKCLFCNRPPECKRTGVQDVDKVKRKIDELSLDPSIERIIITGGEPTLHPKLVEIVRHAKSRGFVVEIQTNGTVLDREKMVELKRAGLDIINFAYHSHLKDLSNRLRGVDFGFETIENNLKNAKDLGFEIHIIHVITTLNYKHLPGFVEHLKEMGLTNVYVNFSIVVPEGWAWENKFVIPNPQDIKPYLVSALKLADAYGISFDISEIVPLCIVPGFEHRAVSTVFRIKKFKIIDEYYTGRRTLDFENPSAEHAAKAPQCTECSMYKICAGTYPRVLEIYGNDVLVPQNKDIDDILERLKVPRDEWAKYRNERVKQKKNFKNLFENRKIEEWGERAYEDMDTLYINIGAKCNENCIFCVIKGNEEKFPDMDLDTFREIVSVFVANGGTKVAITGGEPTIYPALLEMISILENIPEITNINIITNGVKLADESYIKELKKRDVRKVITFSISLHAHTKNHSELITQSVNTFEKTIKGIKNAIKYGFNTSIYYVITTYTYRQLPEFAKFVVENFKGINAVTIAYPFPQGAAIKNTWIYPPISGLRYPLVEAISILESAGIKVAIASCGQLPLCAIPGHEEKLLNTVIEGDAEIMGTISSEVFHSFEFNQDEWVQKNMRKHPLCRRKCVLNQVCHGFWTKHVEKYAFAGVRPVTWETYRGPKVEITRADELDEVLRKASEDIKGKIWLVKTKTDNEKLIAAQKLLQHGIKYYVFI